METMTEVFSRILEIMHSKNNCARHCEALRIFIDNFHVIYS